MYVKRLSIDVLVTLNFAYVYNEPAFDEKVKVVPFCADSLSGKKHSLKKR